MKVVQVFLKFFSKTWPSSVLSSSVESVCGLVGCWFGLFFNSLITFIYCLEIILLNNSTILAYIYIYSSILYQL